MLYLREGTRQAEMLAFPFAAAREPAKLAKRVLSGFELIVKLHNYRKESHCKLCWNSMLFGFFAYEQEKFLIK